MAKKKRTARVKKIVLGIIGGLVVLIGATIFVFTYEGSTKPILAVADQFQPGESWELVSERVEPPRLACIGSVSCPSIHKVWRSGTVVTQDELARSVAKLGLFIEGDCKVDRGHFNGSTVCSAKGRKQGLNVEVVVDGSAYDTDDNKVILYVD